MLNVYFKQFLLVFGEKCVTLYRRAYAVPSEKDARMGGTLHNVKSVIDALFCGYSKLPHSKLPVKDNVRSDCCGYAIIVSQSVHARVYYILSAHFSGYVLHSGVGRLSTRSPARLW